MHSITDRRNLIFYKKNCKTFRPELVSIDIKLKFIKNIKKRLSYESLIN